ncbi:MAG: type IV toxin-antitoxin system AbiEi family antitoxin [Prevotellaceae bacterium]|jgi:predicted transcriptional regulator of viral defense system|nr:type IV toxin-antitoxin system AbiEi family antitoxin [Prevotellaceae bacterium]
MDDVNYNDWNMLFHNYLEHGRYTFTYEEISNKFSLSDAAISLQLLYYSNKKRIFQIRKGFYGILTPENSVNGVLPSDLFIDALMEHLNKPYYIALLSAAALHGSAHQKPMVDFVISQTPAPRSIVNKKMKLYFVSKNSWEQSGIVQIKTRAGYIKVSSPELTAFDLIVYSSKFGINRVTTVLQELCEVMKPAALKRIAQTQETVAIQRLGYILEKIEEKEKLSNVLYKILEKRKVFLAPLSVKKTKKGEIDKKWKIIINMQIETDL